MLPSLMSACLWSAPGLRRKCQIRTWDRTSLSSSYCDLYSLMQGCQLFSRFSCHPYVIKKQTHQGKFLASLWKHKFSREFNWPLRNATFVLLSCFHGNVKEKEILKAIPKNLASFLSKFFLRIFCSAAEISASWQHWPWQALLIRRLQSITPRKPYG